MIKKVLKNFDEEDSEELYLPRVKRAAAFGLKLDRKPDWAIIRTKIMKKVKRLVKSDTKLQNKREKLINSDRDLESNGQKSEFHPIPVALIDLSESKSS
jgi:hypothetical protein